MIFMKRLSRSSRPTGPVIFVRALSALHGVVVSRPDDVFGVQRHAFVRVRHQGNDPGTRRTR